MEIVSEQTIIKHFECIENILDTDLIETGSIKVRGPHSIFGLSGSDFDARIEFVATGKKTKMMHGFGTVGPGSDWKKDPPADDVNVSIFDEDNHERKNKRNIKIYITFSKL